MGFIMQTNFSFQSFRRRSFLNTVFRVWTKVCGRGHFHFIQPPFCFSSPYLVGMNEIWANLYILEKLNMFNTNVLECIVLRYRYGIRTGFQSMGSSNSKHFSVQIINTYPEFYCFRYRKLTIKIICLALTDVFISSAPFYLLMTLYLVYKQH